MITHLVKVQVVQTCNNNIFIYSSVFNDIYNIFLLSVLLHTTEMTSHLEPQAAVVVSLQSFLQSFVFCNKKCILHLFLKEPAPKRSQFSN